jgi:phage gp46-like protein
MDLAILYNGRAFTFDLATAGADLATEDGLRAAVLVSLFTDRHAEADDPLPGAPNSADRRGWWADAWPELDGDRIGSRLWLLGREKQTADVLQRAQVYSEEALAWLIEDGVALAVSVTAEWMATGVLGLHVALRLADGGRFEDVFDYPLEAA